MIKYRLSRYSDGTQFEFQWLFSNSMICLEKTWDAFDDTFSVTPLILGRNILLFTRYEESTFLFSDIYIILGHCYNNGFWKSISFIFLFFLLLEGKLIPKKDTDVSCICMYEDVFYIRCTLHFFFVGANFLHLYVKFHQTVSASSQ